MTKVGTGTFLNLIERILDGMFFAILKYASSNAERSERQTPVGEIYDPINKIGFLLSRENCVSSELFLV